MERILQADIWEIVELSVAAEKLLFGGTTVMEEEKI